MDEPMKLQIGPKGKEAVTVAPDRPGLERGAKTSRRQLAGCLTVGVL